jgi:hypothetical protein
MPTALKIMVAAAVLGLPTLLGGCETRQVGQARYYLVDPDTQYVGGGTIESTRVRGDYGIMGGYEPDRDQPTFREKK